MISRKFKDISTNTFMASIVLDVTYPDGNSTLEFKTLVLTGKPDINSVQKASLHPEANKMVFTLLPESANLEDIAPITFEYTGSWSEFIARIKLSLLELNRQDTSLASKLTFRLNESRTNIKQIIKSSGTVENKFTQLITETDTEFAAAEKLIKDVISLENTQTMNKIKDYIYNIMVN